MYKTRKPTGQGVLFNTLADTLNQQHPLYRLANRIDWRRFEDAFGPLYSAAFHAESDIISESDLNFNHSEPIADDDLSLRNPDKDREKIIEAYRRGGNWKQAAKLLNITEKTLINLRNKYGIDSNGEFKG